MLVWLLLACTQPVSGRYEVILDDTTSDCPASATPSADGSWNQRFTLQSDFVLQTDDGHLRVFSGDDGTCPPADEGDSFTCELAWLDTEADYAGGGVDAVVKVDVDLAATWVAARKVTGQTVLSVSCAGVECAAVEASSPPLCTTTWAWTGRLP